MTVRGCLPLDSLSLLPPVSCSCAKLFGRGREVLQGATSRWVHDEGEDGGKERKDTWREKYLPLSFNFHYVLVVFVVGGGDGDDGIGGDDDDGQ